MDLFQKEVHILSLIKEIFCQMITDYPTLLLRSVSRQGAEISDILEDKFVEIAQSKPGIITVAGAPKGKIKHPYDIYFIYQFANNEEELVWIDIKTSNLKSKDSNPDMGTYKKFLKFFKEGHYFAVYCKLAYIPDKENLRFVDTPQGERVTVFLLKDIHSSFRIQPNNQLQVNYSKPPEVRTLNDFIELLQKKVQESLERKKKKVEAEINKINHEFEAVKQNLQNTRFR